MLTTFTFIFVDVFFCLSESLTCLRFEISSTLRTLYEITITRLNKTSRLLESATINPSVKTRTITAAQATWLAAAHCWRAGAAGLRADCIRRREYLTRGTDRRRSKWSCDNTRHAGLIYVSDDTDSLSAIAPRTLSSLFSTSLHGHMASLKGTLRCPSHVKRAENCLNRPF